MPLFLLILSRFFSRYPRFHSFTLLPSGLSPVPISSASCCFLCRSEFQFQPIANRSSEDLQRQQSVRLVEQRRQVIGSNRRTTGIDWLRLKQQRSSPHSNGLIRLLSVVVRRTTMLLTSLSPRRPLRSLLTDRTYSCLATYPVDIHGLRVVHMPQRRHTQTRRNPLAPPASPEGEENSRGDRNSDRRRHCCPGRIAAATHPDTGSLPRSNDRASNQPTSLPAEPPVRMYCRNVIRNKWSANNRV